MVGSTPERRRTGQISVFLCAEAWSSSQIKLLSCLWVMDCCCSWQLGWLQGDELECSDGPHTVWKEIKLQQLECSSTLCFKSQKHFKTFDSFEAVKQTPWSTRSQAQRSSLWDLGLQGSEFTKWWALFLRNEALSAPLGKHCLPVTVLNMRWQRWMLLPQELNPVHFAH